MDLAFSLGFGGAGQAAKLLPGQSPVPQGDDLPGVSVPTVVQPRAVVRTVDDITVGLGLQPGIVGLVNRLVAEGARSPLELTTYIRTALRKLAVPAVLINEITTRAHTFTQPRWLAQQRKLAAPMQKGGPYIGPQGGKWADPQHKISWHPPTSPQARIRNALGELGLDADAAPSHNGRVVVTLPESALEHHQGIAKALKGWKLVGHQKAGGKVRMEMAPIKGGKAGPAATAALAAAGLHGVAGPGRDPGVTTITLPAHQVNPQTFHEKATAALGAAGLAVHNTHVGSDNAYINISDGAPGPALHEVVSSAPFNPPGLAHAIAGSLGLTVDQVREIVTTPGHPGQSRVEGVIYKGGHARKDAVRDLLVLQDHGAHVERTLALAKGDAARVVEEFKHTPTRDLDDASSLAAVPHVIQGQAYCTSNHDIVVGLSPYTGDYTTGDFRHELGHAVHFKMIKGADPTLKNACAAEWADLQGRRAKVKPPAGGHTEVWAEEAWGAISDRSLDNWFEHAAEHYRGYHREVLRDRFKTGTELATYRARHPGWAKIWDARYTAALLGATALKGDW